MYSYWFGGSFDLIFDLNLVRKWYVITINSLCGIEWVASLLRIFERVLAVGNRGLRLKDKNRAFFLECRCDIVVFMGFVSCDVLNDSVTNILQFYISTSSVKVVLSDSQRISLCFWKICEKIIRTYFNEFSNETGFKKQLSVKV